MWSMEYNPNMFAVYESSNRSSANINGLDAGPTDGSTIKKYGRFEKRYLQAGQSSGANHPPFSIFLVASVLESKNKYLMKDAKGLDDVVKVSLSLSCLLILFLTFLCFCIEIFLQIIHVISHVSLLLPTYLLFAICI
jgi:hypothetical protein